MALKKDILIDKYIEALESGEIPWEKGWNTTRPHNPITGTEYNGFNRLWLTFISHEKGYKDTRWFTFNEIADFKNKYHPDEKWKLKKGSEGVEISKKPSYYNEVEDKYYNSRQYYKILASLDDGEKEQFKNECKMIWNNKDILYIYNAEEIDGIAPEQGIEVDPMTMDKMNTIIENMGVEYEEQVQDKSYYVQSFDKVVTPPKERFKDESLYFATLLHELSHATGHASRLNRDLSGEFGSEKYAIEELRADIGSAFLMADFGLEFDESHVNNHLAYIQNWAKVLKNDRTILQEAIKDAEMINDYVVEMSKQREMMLSKEMENTALDINNMHVTINPGFEGLNYTVFDSNYHIMDGGLIELNDGQSISAKSFIEFINTKAMNIDLNDYKAARSDYEDIFEKANRMCTLDDRYKRTFNVDQMGYFVSEILENGEIVLDAHEDHRMFFSKEEASQLSKNIPMSHITDNREFVEILKSNIIKGLQSESEVNEIYKKPDSAIFKNISSAKQQIDNTLNYGRGR